MLPVKKEEAIMHIEDKKKSQIFPVFYKLQLSSIRLIYMWVVKNN